jgi:hydroxymethylbilane synthase
MTEMKGPYRLITSLNLDRHEILLVGGGSVAERKAATLLRAGARVRLVSPDAAESLRNMAENGEIVWEERRVSADDFKGCSFAVVAVPDEIAGGVAEMARGCGCLIDDCSDGRRGDFALCAQFEAGGCFVGVSSGGGDPARAAAMKRGLIGLLDKPEAKSASPAEANDDAISVLTRSSPLAMAQADMWVKALSGAGVTAAVKIVTSHGDRDRKSDLSKFGYGAFVKALEDELMSGSGDYAVHSLKDMPVVLPEGCAISAVLERASVYDVLITRDGASLESLAPGSRVGTSSLRRRAQVRSARRDLECVLCRGNVETRLKKLEGGEVDAILLAEAGLDRLGINLPGAERLPFVTAAGQGAIAIEARVGSVAEGIARSMNHLPTWCEVTAERALLGLFGLGCTSPIGVRGSWFDGRMELTVAIYSPTPTENPEDERAILSLNELVASESDATALATELWNEARALPLTRRILNDCGGGE